MVSPLLTLKLFSKFHTPPDSLANAVIMLLEKVVTLREFPVAAITV
jgi:hypothetical protein